MLEVAAGGYTSTKRNISIINEVTYDIVVGEGGESNGNGGTTFAFGDIASGGYAGTYSSSIGYAAPGGNGGSGGAAGNRYGGSNGENSADNNGKGQIELPGPNGETGNTCEFGEDIYQLYSGGGGGGRYDTVEANEALGGGGIGGHWGNGFDGGANTGGGGGGASHGYYIGGRGGSGIVIIRNAR